MNAYKSVAKLIIHAQIKYVEIIQASSPAQKSLLTDGIAYIKPWEIIKLVY